MEYGDEARAEGVMQRMESDEGSLDLAIVRPDRNECCTSSSPSSPPRCEKSDVTSLSIFELEEAVKRFSRYLKDFAMKDNNAKLRHCLLEFENELARRRSPAQTGNQVIQVEAVGRTQTKPTLAKKKREVFDLEIEFSSQLPRPSPEKDYPPIALDCDKEDDLSSAAHTKEREVNEIQDLEKVDVKVCTVCHQSVTPERNEADGCFRCTRCKKSLICSQTNGGTPVNSTRNNFCGFTRLNESSGSAKRSQQSIGDTFDTALELSDDEELKEVVVGESSSSRNLLKRKCLRNTSEKLADTKFLYPSSSDLEAVEVRYADLCHLAPTEFLNDTVIDFYMKYMQMNFLEEKDRSHRFHFFSCFFYKKLTSSRAQGKDWFEKLHKWTKGINIFKKLYLFIPIHDSCHWSLAVVCFPLGQRVPVILHLDSMSATAGHSSQVIFNALKRLNESGYVSTNYTDTLWMVRSMGLASKQSLIEQIHLSVFSWLETDIERKIGKKAWYNAPVVIISQLLHPEKYILALKKLLAEKDNMLPTTEFQSAYKKTFFETDGPSCCITKHVLAIVDPNLGDEWWRTLRSIEWPKRPKWLTEERLYSLACADLPREAYILRAMASNAMDNILSLHIPQNCE